MNILFFITISFYKVPQSGKSRVRYVLTQAMENKCLWFEKVQNDNLKLTEDDVVNVNQNFSITNTMQVEILSDVKS